MRTRLSKDAPCHASTKVAPVYPISSGTSTTMPVLVPSMSPPSPGLPKAQASSPAATIPSESVDQSKDTKSDAPETFSTVSRISLDLENISDRIASDLAVSLVGHVLFLKSQVPLCVYLRHFYFVFLSSSFSPVLQLERIPGSKVRAPDFLCSFFCSHTSYL